GRREGSGFYPKNLPGFPSSCDLRILSTVKHPRKTGDNVLVAERGVFEVDVFFGEVAIEDAASVGANPRDGDFLVPIPGPLALDEHGAVGGNEVGLVQVAVVRKRRGEHRGGG